MKTYRKLIFYGVICKFSSADDGKLFVGTGIGEHFGPECNKGLFQYSAIGHLLFVIYCFL